jgi:hypothetical protein
MSDTEYIKLSKLQLQLLVRKAWCEGYKFGGSTIETKGAYFVEDYLIAEYLPEQNKEVK